MNQKHKLTFLTIENEDGKEKIILSKFAILQKKWVIYLILLDTISKFTQVTWSFYFKCSNKSCFQRGTSPFPVQQTWQISSRRSRAYKCPLKLGEMPGATLVQKEVYRGTAVLVVVLVGKGYFFVCTTEKAMYRTLCSEVFIKIYVYIFRYIDLCLYSFFNL